MLLRARQQAVRIGAHSIAANQAVKILSVHFRDTVSSAAEYLEKALDKWRWPFLLLLSFTFLASTLTLASAKLLWHDEISTSYLSRLPSLADITAALKMGLDAHPPLSFLFF